MTLAVIGTFYRRHENSLPILRRLLETTRQPDEAWLMCETVEDEDALVDAFRDLYELEVVDEWPGWLNIVVLPTDRDRAGGYTVIPYSNKINWALDHTRCDLIVYLDNGSMPSPEKYEVMAAALESHPEWGAVYCTQKRTGYLDETHVADAVVGDAHCVTNYTQVMHRRTTDRWPLGMEHANPDLADAIFWRSLHATLGPFYPVGGERVHDTHHMPSPVAAGIT